MLKFSGKGVILSGIAGYLILSKAFNLLNRTVNRVCDAAEWRSYYRHGKDGNMVPPGYSSHTHQINDEEQMVVEKNPKKPEKQTPTGTALDEALAGAVKDVIRTAVDGLKEPEGAFQGQREASEEENNGCDGDCMNCTKDPCDIAQGDADDSEFLDQDRVKDPQKFIQYVQDCQEKCMSEKEIALSLGLDVSVYRRNVAECLDILRERKTDEIEDPFYKDDLEEGVKVVDPDVDLEGEDE